MLVSLGDELSERPPFEGDRSFRVQAVGSPDTSPSIR